MIADRNQILDDLYAESVNFNCYGCEFTEEDVDYVLKLQNEGHPYIDAISICLDGIDGVLGY